ncbi:MAG: RNA polymerase factor sigma-32 [bacterium]
MAGKKSGNKKPAKKKQVRQKKGSKKTRKAGASSKGPEPAAERDTSVKPEAEEPEADLEELSDLAEESPDTRHGDLDTDIEKEVTSLAPSAPVSMEHASILQRYLMEIRNYPLLDKESEHGLAVRYQEHQDLNAARTLVSSNLRLVVKIALEYYRNWMDLLDLIQEGNVGLMQAVKKFDPYRGIRLSTYASFWIRAYILKFLMDNWRLVKIGTTQAQRKLFFNLKKEKDRLEQFGFEPGSRMLAQSLDVKESEISEMDQRLSGRDESLDKPVTEDGNQTREMTLPDEQTPVDEALADDQFHRIIKHKLTSFRKALEDPEHEKEAFIFDNRLMSEEPLTLQEVGEEFGISRERVRQLEARLVNRIKEHLKSELPDYEDYEFVLK